jgi:hypothetical protein
MRISEKSSEWPTHLNGGQGHAFSPPTIASPKSQEGVPMSWQPPSESPLVDCSVQPREGVRFDLWVGEKHLCYSRVKTLAFSDPLETVTIERSAVSNVTLRKKSPWALRLIGLALIAATTAGVIGFMVGTIDRFPFVVLLGYVLGGACFVGSSNRWQLSFSVGKKTHTIVQPVASDKRVMTAMAESIQKAGQLLSASSTAG